MKSTGFDKDINDVLSHLNHIFGGRLHDQKQENSIPVNDDEYQASPSIFFKATNSGQTNIIILRHPDKKVVFH